MVMVLLFRINEKIVTPTTVILMTMATIPGFLVHVLCLKDFSPAVEIAKNREKAHWQERTIGSPHRYVLG
jgi:hypothetical protein